MSAGNGINLESIPQCQVNTVMDALVKGMRDYYSRPEAEASFRAWIAKEENRKRVEDIKAMRTVTDRQAG